MSGFRELQGGALTRRRECLWKRDTQGAAPSLSLSLPTLSDSEKGLGRTKREGLELQARKRLFTGSQSSGHLDLRLPPPGP